jgi:hypothetical protein
MVMRNKHDGSSSNGWWDDLPPAVKKRVTPAESPAAEDTDAGHSPPAAATPCRPAILVDLSRLAILFVAVALGNLAFLLIALSFLSGHTPF